MLVSSPSRLPRPSTDLASGISHSTEAHHHIACPLTSSSLWQLSFSDRVYSQGEPMDLSSRFRSVKSPLFRQFVPSSGSRPLA
ncbi:hypothetical protein J6590_095992, partial [Homalodisca vitripennis]